jgi:hypothetical protein
MSISTYSDLKNRINFSVLPFTFSQEYANFIKHHYGNEVIYFEKNETIVPLELVGKKIFQQVKLIDSPYCNGVCLAGSDLKLFLDDLISSLKKSNQFIRIIQPHPMAFTSEKPDNSKWCEFGTYVNYLQNKSDEELLNEFDVKYKKAVLHSIKNNGTVLIHQNKLNEFYEIYRATCERANIHCDSLNYFKSLINYLPHNTIAAVINDDEGNSIGAGFFIYDQHSCYCTHAGSIQGSKLYGGMKHLHYEVMKQMREKGVHKYDLTGVRINSTNESLQGIFKFKKGFGGELKQGYLWKTDLNKFKCFIYDNLLLLKTKGKKRKDIIDQEN